MSCIGTGYHTKCRNCGKRIKGARYNFCKTCREKAQESPKKVEDIEYGMQRGDDLTPRTV